MKRLAILFFLAATAIQLAALTDAALAQPCTTEDFSSVVDDTARALRELNADGAERYNAKLRAFQQKHNLSHDELRKRVAALQDDRVSEFNREIEALVNQMDVLSRTPADQIDCKKLAELKQVRDRLLTVMGQKSGYMLANVDDSLENTLAEAKPESPGSEKVQRQAKADRIEGAGKAPASEETAVQDAPSGQETALLLPPEDAKPERAQPPSQAPVVDPGLPERRPARAHRDTTPPVTEETAPPTREDGRLASSEPLSSEDSTAWAPTAITLPPPGPEDETYSIDEIRDAGRGIFGTITAEFAAAVNYAVQQFGRPNAYITGSEGSAAFLAGLRYGEGTLHIKNGEDSEIYWQGPSLGYDVGAEGSSTLFLVYNLKKQDRIYGRFTGIGGSAYVAGGFGVNVLGKGGMVMVPIRTGIGLRLGANLAYLKFTEHQTWNPF